LRPPSLALSYIGSVTARHSSSWRESNFAALSTRRHLYSEGRPSRWALAHIPVNYIYLRNYDYGYDDDNDDDNKRNKIYSRADAGNHCAMRGTCTESLHLIFRQPVNRNNTKTIGKHGELVNNHFTNAPVEDWCMSPHGIKGPRDQSSRNSGIKC